MAGERNQIETVEVKIRTTPQVASYLEKLVDTGLYGKNRSEAAERLLAEALRKLVDSDKL